MVLFSSSFNERLYTSWIRGQVGKWVCLVGRLCPCMTNIFICHNLPFVVTTELRWAAIIWSYCIISVKLKCTITVCDVCLHTQCGLFLDIGL